MFIEHPEALKTWLKTMLSRVCDADPEALAKYILALVKKDKGSNSLKPFLLEQLEVFLIEDTRSFVNLLISALEKKSYLVSSTDVGSPLIDSASENNIGDPSPENEEEAVKNKSTNNSTDKLHRSREWDNSLSGSRKRRNDFDKDNSYVPSKRSLSVCKDYYPTKTERDKRSDVIKSRGEDSPRKSRSRSKSPREEYIYKVVGEHSVCDQSDYKIDLDFSKSIHHSDSSHGDTDYRDKRQMTDPTTTNISLSTTENNRESTTYSTKQSARCKDYDEKGYCLKGDFCTFDHGSDPILVEHVSALNFPHVSPDEFEGASAPDGTQLSLPPLPTSPPNIPPPPPPLPPPPPTGSFLPEPYNPEAPGMNMTRGSHPHTHLSYYLPLPETPHHIPLSHPPPPMTSTPRLMYAEPFHKPKQRQRELIGVQTIDSSSMTLDRRNKDDRARTYLKPLTNVYSCGIGAPKVQQAANKSDFKAKGFDFSRLGGPCPRKCLEIRKIPKSLNTIANLATHFSKFGNIVNIEVGFNNDPEAAKVTFQTNGEATAAYRSTEPILNNRFIKVFWNTNPQHDFGKGINTPISNEVNTKGSPDNNKKVSLDTGISEESNEDLRYPSHPQNALDKVVEKNFLANKGNMSRSVFVSSLNSAKRKSFSTFRKGFQEREGALTAHKKMKLELHQTKTEFIKTTIEHQKIILDQLIKCKSSKEREFLKTTLDKISNKIMELNKDLKKDNEELKNLLRGPSSQVAISKTAAKKELLDAELELYNKQHTGDEDASELILKVNEMKNKAKALGIIENSPRTPKYTYRRHGNSRYHLNSTNASLSIDHRPRKILVIGSHPLDKEGLNYHFKKFGDIEKAEEMSGGIVITFCTRMEAEAAYVHGAKFKENNLTLSWFSGPQPSVPQNTDFSNEEPELEPIEAPLVDIDDDDDDEEEEEEEDSEARSWRR